MAHLHKSLVELKGTGEYPSHLGMAGEDWKVWLCSNYKGGSYMKADPWSSTPRFHLHWKHIQMQDLQKGKKF